MDPRALFEVQRLDTAIDQARHALAHLPELAIEKSAAEKLGALRARIGDLMREQGTLESELASIEKRDAEIANHLARLEKQMKTVIAPREAEALQHEMRVLVIERESGDERGLEILDSAATTAEALDEALALAAVGVRGAEEAARVVIDGLAVEREAATRSIDASDLQAYERLRTTHAGVAIAEIKHGVCGGCHMDISASEMDAIKRLPVDQVAECPNCTRLLVR
jgi:predicted  nucleic acid-binding Zn-ribbon protein